MTKEWFVAVIELSYADMLLAAMSGVMRNLENMDLDRKPAYGIEKSSVGEWQASIVGSCGEMAVARYYGLQWYGKGDFRGPDAGNVQVRTTQFQGSDVRLILHPRDADDEMFYPVRWINGTRKFELFSPVLGRHGKLEKFWQTFTGRPCYFVPVLPE